MYVPRGFGLSEVGDVEIVPHGDELHLFHLTLPNHDVVQHAVSTDGLSWRELPAALRTGDPGACDDDQIWTMSVTERNGAFIMVYTALAKAEDGLVQRTAVAHSTDLISWRKSERNPVAEADPRWYEADVQASGRVSWRDPKPILVDGTYYAVVCAREKDGPLPRRGCAGLMASTDLETWEVRPPLFAPRRFWDLECPQVFTINGTYYLTAAIMEDQTQRYWMAPSFDGPYTVPPDGGILAPQGHYAGRICHWQGRDIYMCWHRPPGSGSSVAIDWTTSRNPFGKFVPAPLVLSQRPDGSLARRSFPNWEAYREAPLRQPASLPRSLLHGRPVTSDSAWTLDSGPGQMDILTTSTEHADLYAEGALTLNATIGGLAFRLDEHGGGYFVELQADSTSVVLKKWLLVRDPLTEKPWFRVQELQRGELIQPYPADTEVRFTLILFGPYIELSLDDEVVLATLSAERRTGRIGVSAESGQIGLRDFATAPLRFPAQS